MANNRLLELDALRGIAALAVVLFHFTTRYQELYGFTSQPLLSVPLGHYGVQLFFIVSGFVIFLTLSNCRHPLDFVVSRFARLYPVYWAAILVTFSCLTLFELEGVDITARDALINLTMLQGFIGVPNVDGVYWSLKWELVFYFISFTIFVASFQRYILGICFGWLAIQLLLHFAAQQSIVIPGIIKYPLISPYCNLFVAGIVFYKLKYQAPRRVYYMLLGFSLLNQYALYGVESVAVVAVFFALFYLFSRGKLTIIGVKPLVFLGTISYSLYLIHEYVGWIVIRELLQAGLEVNLTLLLAIGFVTGLATAMTFLIEKPAMTWIRSAYKDSWRGKLVAQAHT